MSLLSRVLRARLTKALGWTVLTALVIGTTYEECGRRADRARLPRIGQAVDIGGRSLTIDCAGEGQPVVVLDSGANSSGYAWAQIQSRIAPLTRTCWYDRAGEGWSDPGPFPRTSAAIASDLHALLTRAAIPPPYVLVGHSFGGLNVRVYTGHYPSEVAALVLVDSAHEDEPRRAPPFMLGPKPPRMLWRPLDWLFRASARVGLVRLTKPAVPLSPDPSRRMRAEIVEALRNRPQTVATVAATGVVAPDSYEQARAAGGLGDRPLIVLTRGKLPEPTGDPAIDRAAADYQRRWMHELQAQLARLSTRGRQVIVDSSGHGIPEEAPDAVIDAIRDVVAAVRQPRGASENTR